MATETALMNTVLQALALLSLGLPTVPRQGGVLIGDIQVPPGAGLPEAPDRIERESVEGLPVEVLRGDTVEDAASAAVLDLDDSGEGVRLIETGSGLGVVSTSVAYYASDSASEDLVLISQRGAFLEADLRARAGMMEFLQGALLEGRSDLLRRFSTSDEGHSTRVDSEESSLERVTSLAEGYLRGAITYLIDDQPTEGRILVSVVSTPRTQRAVRQRSSRTMTVSDFLDGQNWLHAEIRRGVLPPEGARIIVIPTTGEVAWIGYGSALLPARASKDPRLRGQASRSAQLAAERRAQTCLVRALRGEELVASDCLDSSFSKSIQAYDDLLGGVSELQSSTSHQQATSEAMASAIAGGLPPGTTTTTLHSSDGRWVYSVCLYREGGDGPEGGSRAVSSATNDQAVPPGASSASARLQDACEGPVEEGVKRVLARGEGMTRSLAVKAALLEAVERVNGVQIEGSSALRVQFRDAIADLNGKLDSVVEAETSTDEEVYTRANGMIRSYEVISESEGATDGSVSVEVCALLPVFDPARPRPGRRPTLAVLPVSTTQATFELAGEQVASRPIADAMTGILVAALADDGTFTVLDREHMQEIQSELSAIEQGVAAGAIEAGECVKLGHRLGADFIVVGTLDRLEYLSWSEYVPVLRREEPRERLSIRSSVQILNVSTGAVVKGSSDRYDSSWTLLDLLPENLADGELGLSRQTLACRRATQSHLGRLFSALRRLQKQQKPQFLSAIGVDQCVLKYEGTAYGIGDELVVRGILRVELDGELNEIEVDKGRIRITRVDRGKAHLYCELVEGDLASFQVGDVAGL